MGVKTTALAGLIHRLCVIYAGETGKSCREFPGARPACRGTPETPADNIGCSLRARTEVVVQYTAWVFGSGLSATSLEMISKAQGAK